MADPYRVLGVRRDATPEEVKRAFTALALALHPDTSASASGPASAGRGAAADAERFARAKEAFDILRDAGRRAAHDRRVSGFAGSGGGFAGGAPGYSPEDLRRRAEEFELWRRAQPARPAGAGAGAGFAEAGDFGPGSAPHSGASRGASGHALFIRLMERALRPRSVAALLALPAAVWFCTALLAREADVSGEAYGDSAGRERVRAWLNPRSQQWEPPAPWDPLFQAHRGATKMVARRDVRPSTLPPAPASASTAIAAAVAARENSDAERFVAAALPAAAAATATPAPPPPPQQQQQQQQQSPQLQQSQPFLPPQPPPPPSLEASGHAVSGIVLR